jgi:3',5'-cyclic AMP phosphodiesterase CpdA
MRILLVTDTHLAAAATPCTENWLAAKAFARRLKPDLTIHLGDITFDGIDDPTQHEWALAAAADWPTPLRYLPGNHDIGDNPPGPGVPYPQPLEEAQLERYRALFGADYWTLDAAPWLLIGIDAQLLGSDTQAEAEQATWLDGVLKGARRRPVGLLVHKPLFQDDPADVPLAPRRQLLQRLAAVDLRFVLSGHAHQYLDRVIAGVRHIWLPSSAFVIPDGAQERIGEKVVGVGLLDLNAHGYSFDLVCPDGMTQYSGAHPVLSALAAKSRSLSGAPAGNAS